MSIVAENPAKTLRVFVAASRSNAGEIEKTLLENGLVPVTVESDAIPGTTWVDSLHKCIQTVDVVVGMIGGDRNEDTNVFFELGVASALNKPAVLLIPPDYPHEVVPPSGILYLRTDLRNQNAVMFGLEQIRSISRREAAHSFKEIQHTRPIGPLADELIERLHHSGSGREHELEEVIYDATRASGVTTIARGYEVDLAVWSNDLEPAIANPVLIECQYSLSSPPVVNEVIGRMFRALDVIQNGCGLVVYRDANPFVLKVLPKSLPVIFISAEDFLKGLRDNGFASLVRRLRNAAVHGK